MLLLALVFATPGLSRGSTLFRSGLALLALFLSHVVHFLVAIEMIYATQLGEWSTVAYAPWKNQQVKVKLFQTSIIERAEKDITPFNSTGR